MATIPIAERLARQADAGQAPVGSARVDVSSGVQSLAGVLGGIRDTAVKYQVSQAASEFMTRKIAEDGAYTDDNDYNTIEERYSRNITDALNESATLISDGAARNEFMQRYQVDVAQGVQRIRDVARTKEIDYNRAYVNQKLDDLREAGLTGDIRSTMDTATGLLGAARDQGYISAQEYEKMDSDFRNNLAQANLSIMSPEQRLEALGQPWAQNIPKDLRVRITETAQAELVVGQAIANTDGYMADIIAGGTREDAQSKIAQIKDDTVRAETERRFENEYARYTRTKTEEQNGLHQAYFLQVRTGQLSVDDIPDEDLQRMNPTTLKSLFAAESQAAAGRGPAVVSDRNSLFELYSMKALVDSNAATPTELMAKVAELAPTLSQQDYDDWLKIGTEGLVPPETKSLLTAKEGLMLRLESMREAGVLEDSSDTGVDNTFNRMYVEFDEWYRGLQTSTGKAPGEAEQQQKIDRMLLDARWINRVGWAGSLQWRDFNDEEKRTYVDREVRRLQSGGRRDQAIYRTIIGNLPENYTPDQFMELYTRLK